MFRPVRILSFLSVSGLLLAVSAPVSRSEDVIPDPRLCRAAMEGFHALSALDTAILVERAKQERRTTIVFNSETAVQGVFAEVVEAPGTLKPAYLRFKGPTKLLKARLTVDQGAAVVPGHDEDRHSQGFGMPVGAIASLTGEGFLPVLGHRITVRYQSGVVVEGRFIKSLQTEDHILASPSLLTLEDCTVTLGDRVLFQPEWGEYDLLLAESIVAIED